MAQTVGRGTALFFHDRGTRRGWVVSSTPRPHFTPAKNRYPFYRRLDGSQGRSGRAENLAPTGIRSQTVQPVVSRYTDWATGPLYWQNTAHYIYLIHKHSRLLQHVWAISHCHLQGGLIYTRCIYGYNLTMMALNVKIYCKYIITTSTCSSDNIEKLKFYHLVPTGLNFASSLLFILEYYQVKIRLALREVTSCTPVNSYQTIRCYIPDNRDPQGHRRVNLAASEKGVVRITNHSAVTFPLFPQKSWNKASNFSHRSHHLNPCFNPRNDPEFNPTRPCSYILRAVNLD